VDTLPHSAINKLPACKKYLIDVLLISGKRFDSLVMIKIVKINKQEFV